jgi:hypothetical protein
MSLKEIKKKLFLGAEIASPWQEEIEGERTISPKMRYMTLAFLGRVEKEPIIPSISFSSFFYALKVKFQSSDLRHL